jgi:hypothetical protein
MRIPRQESLMYFKTCIELCEVLMTHPGIKCDRTLRNLIKLLSQNLFGVTEENQAKSQSGRMVFGTRYGPGT